MRNRVRKLVSYIPSSKMLTTSSYLVSNSFSNGVKNGGEGKKETVEESEVREVKLFDDAFDLVTKKLTSNIDPDLGPVSDWMRQVLTYNVPHGKKNRGMAVVYTYKMLLDCKNRYKAKDLPAEVDKSDLARILGWCIEILQGFFLVHDDIMDQSLMRRSQPCWYKNKNVGLIAINDGIMLNSCVYTMLRECLSQEPTYLYMIQLFNEITDLTAKGQCLDVIQSSSVSLSKGYASYNEKIYSAIVKYKTAYYTFSLPVRLALYLANVTDKNVHAKAEEILLKCGHFFQVQDDYLDCYGDPKVIGKVGRDIQEGKCCWPFVTALKACNEEQKKILLENYGKEDAKCVQKVKEIYNKINLPKIYADYENETYKELLSIVGKFEYIDQVPIQVFDWILKKIYHRKY